MSRISATLEAFSAHKEEHLRMLRELVKIPSVSFHGFDQGEVERCAHQVKEYVQACGLENIELIYVKPNQRPYLYADWLHAPDAPTLLLYAHYDVQPPGHADRWQSPAFAPTEREGRLYGRGAADDKGGLMVHLAAIQAYLQAQGALPVNVKLLFEGEEESGSECLEDFLLKYRDKLAADIIIIPDVENFDEDIPGITVSLRGIVAAQVEIKALRQPLHSGMWGGAIPDPAAAMARVLATLIDDEGAIAVPAIRAMIPRLSSQRKAELRELPFDETKVRRDAGLLPSVPQLGEPRSLRERIWYQPALTVNGVQASSRQQASNIICDHAWAKISVRTVPPMDKAKVFAALKEHLESQNPFGLKVEVHEESLGDWWETHLDHPALQAMIRALEEAWGRAPVKMGCGGSIPFVKLFTDALGGVPALLIGVEDPQTRAHSENESLSLAGWDKSVRACIYLFEELAHLKK